MLRTLRLTPFALYVICSLPALAESDFQQWATVVAKADVGDAFAIQGEAIARFSDDSGGLYELESSFLLGYKLGDRVTAWAGYVHNPTYRAGDFVIMERRAREQLTIDNVAKIGPASLSARLRLEQRWRDGIDGTGWRVRPYVKAAIPLGDKRSPVLNFTVEPFVNLNTTSFQVRSGLDRVRSAVSFTIPVADAVKLEAGYLNQHRFIRGDEDRGDHVVTATVSLSL